MERGEAASADGSDAAPPGDDSEERGGVERTFERFASASSRVAGHSIAFGAAVGLVVIWALLGPVFGFSDTWQLVINTGTTVLTFLMVFLIQSALNRDSVALHLKLDELIRATGRARNTFMSVEDLDERQMRALQRQLEHALGRAEPSGSADT